MTPRKRSVTSEKGTIGTKLGEERVNFDSQIFSVKRSERYEKVRIMKIIFRGRERESERLVKKSENCEENLPRKRERMIAVTQRKRDE